VLHHRRRQMQKHPRLPPPRRNPNRMPRRHRPPLLESRLLRIPRQTNPREGQTPQDPRVLAATGSTPMNLGDWLIVSGVVLVPLVASILFAVLAAFGPPTTEGPYTLSFFPSDASSLPQPQVSSPRAFCCEKRNRPDAC